VRVRPGHRRRPLARASGGKRDRGTMDRRPDVITGALDGRNMYADGVCVTHKVVVCVV
jgi:hypothetical protein